MLRKKIILILSSLYGRNSKLLPMKKCQRVRSKNGRKNIADVFLYFALFVVFVTYKNLQFAMISCPVLNKWSLLHLTLYL